MEDSIQLVHELAPLFQKRGVAPELAQRIARLEAWAKAIFELEEKLQAELGGGTAKLQEIGKSGAEMERVLQGILKDYEAATPASGDFAQLLPAFFPELEMMLEKLPEKVTIQQSEDRFRAMPEDKLGLRLRKSGKRLHRRLKVAKVKLGNAFRRSKSIPQPWTQEVPFRPLVRYHLGLRMVEETGTVLRDLEEAVFNRVLRLRGRVRALEAGYLQKTPTAEAKEAGSPDAFLTEIANIPQKLQERLQAALTQSLAELESDLAKGGTLELPAKKVQKLLSEQDFERACKAAAAKANTWTHSRKALLTEWLQFAALAEIQFELLHMAARQDNGISMRIEKRILPLLDQAETELNEMLGEAESCPKRKAELEPVFRKLASEVKKALDQNCIQPLADALIGQNFPLLIEKVEALPTSALPDKKARWTWIGAVEENRAVPPSKVESIAIREILDYDFLPAFSNALQSTQSQLVQSIAEFRARGVEVVQIVDFNLETGLAAVSEGEASPEAAWESVTSGLHRAADNLAVLRKSIHETLHGARNRMVEAAVALSDSLERLKDPKAVSEIRSRLLRAKALQRSKELRQRSWNYVRYALPLLWTWIKSRVRWVQNEAEGLSQKLGLTKASSVITSQVSDFLAESEIAIARLPLVYQRLFRAEAVTDDLLFVPRKASMEELDAAYTNWRKERFAPTVVIGEPGAGRSSLLLKWLAQNRKPSVKAVHLAPKGRITAEGDLCMLVSAALELHPCQNAEELIAAISAMPQPKIVLTEDIEQYFLKHVGGFSAMKAIIRIISETNKKIFWLFSVSPYTWKYLSQTLSINDAVGYSIELEAFSDEEIKEIVMKRHRLSGFKIDFAPSEQDLKSQAFRRAAEESRPGLLKRTYFSDLNKFAASNLAISFLFWMRSAISIEDYTLKVGSLKDIDFSFMDELPPKKSMVLHQLLLHDGMHISELATVMGTTESAARAALLLLLDDGILTQRESTYRINPLLYRNTIQMLKKRNFIH